MNKYAPITTEQVFQLMCNSSVCIMNYDTSLIPSTVMAEILKTSRYRVKKCLKELKENGFVLSGCESIYSSYSEQYFILRGYYLTEKAMQTETYKKAEEEERKLIKECWGC